MKWSSRFLTIAGIPVRVHWTFVLLIVWLAVAHAFSGSGAVAAAEGIGFVLAIFACVVLHEFGHALAARGCGIKTRDITLLPIGGVARLERMPEDPRQELWIALAGPAVNVVIAGVFFTALTLSSGIAALTDMELLGGDFLTKLMYVNVALVVFNLLPAFPMDGGRVLRALLATRLDYVKATQIAATTGQFMAILFAVAGVFMNWFLLFIAFFVYIGAQSEAQLVQARALMRGVPVKAAMQTDFRSLSPRDTFREATEELLRGSQTEFPVVDHNGLHGILSRSGLLEAVHQECYDQPIASSIQRVSPAREGELLEDVVLRMHEEGLSAVPVVRDGQLVGLVTLENVGELLMLNGAGEHSELTCSRRQIPVQV